MVQFIVRIINRIIDLLNVSFQLLFELRFVVFAAMFAMSQRLAGRRGDKEEKRFVFPSPHLAEVCHNNAEEGHKLLELSTLRFSPA